MLFVHYDFAGKRPSNFLAGQQKTDALRNDGEIKSTVLSRYFSFMQGAKSANSGLFKDFRNVAEMEKNN